MTTDTTTITSATALTTNVFTDSSGRAWNLDREMLDHHAHGWQWDGQPYAGVGGPVLHAVEDPTRMERLVALACCAGLWQVPLNAPQDLAHWLDVELLLG